MALSTQWQRFNAPVAADVGQQFRCTDTFEATHVITGLAADPARSDHRVAVRHDDAGELFPFCANGRMHPVEIVADHDLADFAAVMAVVLGLRETSAL